MVSQYSDRILTGHVAGAEVFSCPQRWDRFRGPPNLICNGHRGDPSQGIKRPDPVADHSLPTSAEVNNGSNYTPSPPFRLHGEVLN
jgi:hypothetical protein